MKLSSFAIVLVLGLAGVMLAAFALAASPAPHAARTTVAGGPRFETLDVMIDTQDRPLAAYQLEIKSATVEGVSARIVGIEGGAKSPFVEPPFYDPAALQGGRVVLAAYTLSADLPAGRFRVARVHMMVSGADVPSTDDPAKPAPQYTVSVITAAGADAKSIPLSATITVGGRP